jgi:hypothetical protein
MNAMVVLFVVALPPSAGRPAAECLHVNEKAVLGTWKCDSPHVELVVRSKKGFTTVFTYHNPATGRRGQIGVACSFPESHQVRFGPIADGRLLPGGRLRLTWTLRGAWAASHWPHPRGGVAIFRR